ncbi:carbohydrate esterase [Diplogelasinospora grovesii]|uniref:Pectinesterase n=1 Tax=Diplogelasinospora grovesii TaxID=303347 RepID=A0AAN6SA63_9PEZI|nr:carbohydrate esterase [Diplogelasinospora grovesii]
MKSPRVLPLPLSAVNALSTAASTTSQCIFIYPGTYTEQVLVPARSAQLSIYGYTADTTSYTGNQVTITSSKSQADGLSNDETATLRVKSANLKLYNINVNNGYGKGSQAVALSAYADSGYYGCQFTGYQDTLLAQRGTQLYAKCLIQGATDFIFGYITASGRSASTDPNYYVFNGGTISSSSSSSSAAAVASGTYYLGRPWAAYARVVFQRTSMSSRSGILSILGSGYTSAGWYDGSYM